VFVDEDGLVPGGIGGGFIKGKRIAEEWET